MAESFISIVFIDNFVHKLLNKLFFKRVQNSTSTQKKETNYILRVFKKNIITNYEQLINIFKSSCKDIKLNVVFKTSNRLRNAFEFKDQLPK